MEQAAEQMRSNYGSSKSFTGDSTAKVLQASSVIVFFMHIVWLKQNNNNYCATTAQDRPKGTWRLSL